MDFPTTSGLATTKLMRSLLLLATLTMLCIACVDKASFMGTELTPAQIAEPFHLRNQFDQAVGLEDLTGKVIILTFLYTSCTDICPLTTETLRRAYETLEGDAEDVVFVAISVDPARDTVEQLHRYSDDKGMLNRWSFLTGNETELRPVWQAYYIVAQHEKDNRRDLAEPVHETADQASNKETTLEGYLVSHSAPVYLIDQSGKLRVLFTDMTLDSGPLVHDIRLLLGK